MDFGHWAVLNCPGPPNFQNQLEIGKNGTVIGNPNIFVHKNGEIVTGTQTLTLTPKYWDSYKDSDTGFRISETVPIFWLQVEHLCNCPNFPNFFDQNIGVFCDCPSFLNL